ncbi:MAG TPA: MT-A70 family methyltransferase [Chloroflexota bacterium]|nr:MT-A70 family methyltransferase [Chloroflexota bacterium]
MSAEQIAMAGFVAVRLDAITVHAGRRPLRDVGRLAESIAEFGLLHPITLTEDHLLIAGFHRLQAAKMLGWAAIAALVLSADEVRARLIEIAENLHRTDLSELERVQLLLEEKVYYEAAHRATKHGGAAAKHGGLGGKLGKVAGSATLPPMPASARFTTAKSAESGVAERTIRESLQIAMRLGPDLAARLAGLPISDQTGELLALARLPEAMRVRVADMLIAGGAEDVFQASSRIRRRDHAASFAAWPSPDLPTGDGPWGVLLADPPWLYAQRGHASMRAEKHYPTLPTAEIMALPVPSICAKQAVLYLWATSPLLADAMAVMAAWGFEYRTCGVWVKDRAAQGTWFRQQHELLLVGTTGEPHTPAPGDIISSVIHAPRQGHSEKPACVHQMIERLYPNAQRCELFARTTRAGWSSWGNEVP